MHRNAIVSLLSTTLILLFATAHLSEACYHAAYIRNAMDEDLAADGSFSQETIDALREWGYTALDDLVEMKKETQTRLVALGQLSHASKQQQSEHVELTQRLVRLSKLIDTVGGQRDCTTSGLFWHTDLTAALGEAAATKKPILSLRMLGKLTDEFSCANSRFFRTALYGNEEISKNLRENFVLHWKSVRPVPRITIDFGDGRTLERTITGNSAHYLLDATGRPLDCLPGLHGPGAFTQWLDECKFISGTFSQLDDKSKTKWLGNYHRTRNAQLGIELQNHMRTIDPNFAIGVAAKEHPELAKLTRLDDKAEPPHAVQAAPIAASKFVVEQPILKLAFAAGAVDRFEERMNHGLWEKLAATHAGTEKIDARSIELIRRENPTATEAGEITVSKRVVEDPLVRLVRNFQQNILLDTVRNKYLLHRRIHGWFANEEMAEVEALNKRVYAELFLTPDSDPWLGLKPKSVYTALENDGVTVAAKNQ